MLFLVNASTCLLNTLGLMCGILHDANGAGRVPQDKNWILKEVEVPNIEMLESF